MINLAEKKGKQVAVSMTNDGPIVPITKVNLEKNPNLKRIVKESEQ